MATIEKINSLHEDLQNHPVYQAIKTREHVKEFMKWHVFAVWDFMSLLKGLQREVTCVELPWKPSPYPKDLVRFVNEIVLGEESDIDGKGGYTDHFTMYLEAMKEVGADIYPIQNFLETMDDSNLPAPIKNFVSYNIALAQSGDCHKIAAAFFHGREALIPDIFAPLVNEIKSKQVDCPNMLFYLERHIELDGDHHGDLAQKCFDILCDNSQQRISEGHEAAIYSLKLRDEMWTYILGQLEG
ncbi:DUF3050 domain-containing protein [Bacteriovorax sp. DB6_IX]|uniref:DUF3050 domain-containing protein n=1 Tax=Bacteriovorax sp. DB6_IX TaxID=1353530 RepID=UPI00038A3435|nr:DUF3050 domain-containing protein [Bacteriovorax sp. DB6_IX]EQC52039.1 PF11251 family protein [Bacteriovorax sp. DB6_IX]